MTQLETCPTLDEDIDKIIELTNHQPINAEVVGNRGASSAAIQFHYDVGNEFYKIWLDESLVYSAARWAEPITSTRLAVSLEHAQREKIDFHLRAIKAKKGDAILDIGCGWGATLVGAVSRYDVRRATGLTLSDEQAALINRQSHQNIDVHLLSYERFVADELYDGIVSIGAFEHFVKPDMSEAERVETYRTFFDRVANSLKPKGRVSLQTICWSDIDRETAQRIVPIDVFPESDLPYIPEIFTAACERFTPVYMENSTNDYVFTLEEWLKRIRIGRPTIVEQHGSYLYDFYERYLRTSIIGFKTNRTSLARLVFQKK